jgi:hypothetical protein
MVAQGRTLPGVCEFVVEGYFELPVDPLAKATYQSVAMLARGITIKMDSQGLKPAFWKIRQNGVIIRKGTTTTIINSRCIG